MHIIEEIKVDFKTNFEPSSLMINKGVNKEDSTAPDNDVLYFEDSYTPKDDWFEIDQTTLDILTQNVHKNEKYAKILINKIPDKIEKLFRKLEIEKSKSKNEAFQKMADNPEITIKIEKKLQKYLSKYNAEEKYELYKLLVLYPDRKTTALINFEDGTKFIGLHYDSCTTFEIETAHTSKNRFCLNLGLEDRELYFVNLSLVKIKELILAKNSDENITLKKITPLFFKYYPDYPIIKLKIKPFEYYIAPTDNCIHEGTTLRKKEMDISITYLGYFNT